MVKSLFILLTRKYIHCAALRISGTRTEVSPCLRVFCGPVARYDISVDRDFFHSSMTRNSVRSIIGVHHSRYPACVGWMLSAI